MLHLTRSKSVVGVLAAAVIAASASAASAAFSYNITADNSTQTTTFNFSPFNTFSSNPGALYGTPVVTNTLPAQVAFNFDASISPAFSASVNSSVFLTQSTDGHLVIDLQFDTPVSISANVFEAGIFNVTGNGTVSVNGGEVAIEAVDPIPVETHSSALTATFDNSTGGWTATASTTPFSGAYTNYEISIDNDLVATASDGTASIFKKDFILQITTTPGSGSPPTPEPASLGILALGAIGLIARRRR